MQNVPSREKDLERSKAELPSHLASPRLLCDVFERSAWLWPERVALDIPRSRLRTERERWTYRELQRESDILATHLLHWVKGECLVALLLPRHSPWLFIGQLAAMKAGAAYLSLDPKFPTERLSFLLQDSHAVVTLTCDETQEVWDAVGLSRPSLHIESWLDGRIEKRLLESASGESFLAPQHILQSDSWVPSLELESFTPDSTTTIASTRESIPSTRLCYVIYTSGTTGNPKGVMVEHRNIVHLVETNLAYFSMHERHRVGQAASMSFDVSLEETYLAWGSGSALVVMDDDVVRLGPDLVPWMRRERISILCPTPTLLRTTLCEKPDEELPLLEIVYVGGEALPPDVAQRWSHRIWLENAYGPTECTVTVSRERVLPETSVTIGVPVEGNQAWILNERLEEVNQGSDGELCISGKGVVRGYWNAPELTQEKFIEHSRFGRIYRTGDLVRRQADGRLEFLGRIDSQVKIHGYRIELESIESHLCALPDVLSAVCSVHSEGGRARLIAFVNWSDGASQEVRALRDALRERLPHYMVPEHFVSVTEIPTTPSGKVDRKALLGNVPPKSIEPEESVAPRNPLETILVDVFTRALGLSSPLSIHADFFTWGGNSVLAAQVISELRQHPETAVCAVRELYDHPTIAQLATWLGEKQNALQEEHKVSSWKPRKERELGNPQWTSCLQLLWVSVGVLLGSWMAYGVGFLVVPAILRSWGLLVFLLFLPVFLSALMCLYFPFSVGLTWAVKRCFIGRYSARQAPVWGSFFLRHWLVLRCSQIIPWGMIEGTELKNKVLRCLGARIGSNVHIHRGVKIPGGWDLLDIGDDVCIGRDVALRTVDFCAQEMRLGPVVIESQCTLDIRAGMAPHSRMCKGSFLSSLSMLPEGASLPAGQLGKGVPARVVESAPEAPSSEEVAWSWRRHVWMTLLFRFGVGALLSLPFQLLLLAVVLAWEVSAKDVLGWLFSPSLGEGFILAAMLLGMVLSQLISLGLTAAMVRWLGRIRSGVAPIRSWTTLLVWNKNRLIESVGSLWSGTMFWPVWLRWAGMDIGKNCEISTIMEVVPELVSIGEGTFFADGVYLGGPLYQQGQMLCGQTSLGQETFLGNHVVVPAGASLPKRILVGVCTVAEPKKITENSSWFGHPSFSLPRREVVELERRLTHEPSAGLVVQRFLWESARLGLGFFPMVVLLLWFKVLSFFGESQSLGVLLGLTLPTVAIATGGVFCWVVWLLKWGLLGRVKPGQHGLWSSWVCRWDFLYIAWGAYARRVLQPLEQTLWLAWWLRAMGVRVGKRVFLSGTFAQVVDPDMLHFEDDSTVLCLFQAHSFEDRVLKLGTVRIQSQSTVRANSLLLYGADVGAHTEVAEHSVVMKHEQLRAECLYLGAPTQQMAGLKSP